MKCIAFLFLNRQNSSSNAYLNWVWLLVTTGIAVSLISYNPPQVASVPPSMDCQGLIVDYPSLPLGAGGIHHVPDQGAHSFDGIASPGAMDWMTRTGNLSQRAISRSPSLSSVPSSSTQDFLSTPPSDSLHRLLQVPLVSSIRHRTPQACDKCRERKTKVSRFIACQECNH